MNNKDTVNGIPVEEWLKQHEEEQVDEEVRSVLKEATNVSRYMKPCKTYRVVKEKNGSARYLTKDEIRKEYGMDSLGKMNNTQKMLWVMINEMNENGLMAREIFKYSTASNKSLSGLLSSIWRVVGDDGRGLGFFSRERTDKTKEFRYYKRSDAHFPPFDDFLKLYHQQRIALDKEARKRRVEQEIEEGAKIDAETTTEQKEEAACRETEEHAAKSVATTLEEVKSCVPENININITCRFLFGFIKDNN